MARYTTSGTVNSIQQVNAELEKIQESISELLSREGLSPNEMKDVLDMNSNGIINLPYPSTPTSPVRLGDISSTQKIEVQIPSGVYNIVDYGAVGDNSTDNVTAIRAAIADLKLAGGGVLYIPRGIFRTSGILNIENNMHVQGAGMFQSIIKKTDSADTSAIFSKPEPTVFYARVSFDNLTIEGNWDTKRRELGGSLVSARSIREIYFNSVRFMHGTGFGINVNRCIRAVVNNCRFYYICRDACGVWATPQVIVTNNHFNGNDDDAISLNNESGVGTLDGENVKSACIVSNNTLVDTGSIRVQQAKTTIIHSNTIQRCKGGSAVYLGAKNAGLDRMSNPHTCLVTNNIVTDILDRSISTEINPTENFRIAFKFETIEPIVNSGEPVGYGEINPATGSVYKPFEGYYTHTQGSNTDSVATADTVIFKDNIVKRTLPAVSKYSDWGFGTVFTRFSTDTFAASGFVDPPIPDNFLQCNGMRVEGPVKNLYIQGNLFDHGSGWVIKPVLASSTSGVYDLYWKNVVIENNVFNNFNTGINLSELFANTFQDITIRQNIFDGDPLFLNAGREEISGACTGGWLSQNSCVGINSSNVKNTKIIENTFKNLSVSYLAGSTNRHIVRHKNAFIGEPVSGVNANLFSTLNKGLGLFNSEVLQDNSLFVFEKSDPRDADYKDIPEQAEEYVSGDSPPSYGFYFAGQFVRTLFSPKTTGISMFGFRRLTTGSTHTLGVDWEAVFAVTDVDELPEGGGTPPPATEQWVLSGNNVSITHGACSGITYIDNFLYTLENRDPAFTYRYTNYAIDGTNFELASPDTINVYYSIHWDFTTDTRWVTRSGIIEEYNSSWALTGRTISSIANPRGIATVASDYWVVTNTGIIHRVDNTTLVGTGFTIDTGFTDISGFAAEGDAGTDQRLYFARTDGSVYRVGIDGLNQTQVLSTGISGVTGLDVRGNKLIICTSTTAVEYIKS